MEQGTAGAAQRRLHAVPAPSGGLVPAPLSSRAHAAPEVQDLLAQLDDLRLVLSTDLGLAASAVDADALDVARDVLAGAQDDLAVFEVRAGHALRASAGPPPPQAVPVSRRRSRRLSVLAPALTAAAALVGVLLGVAPTTTPPAASDTSIATDAASSWDQLRRLHEQGAPAELLARAARQLHAEVARLVGAGAAPETLSEALHLLELQRRVLSDPAHAAELSAELAESQRLVAALRATAAGSPAGAVLAEAPLPAVVLPPAAPRAASTTSSRARTAREGAPAPAPAPEPAPASAPAERPRTTAVVPAPAPAPVGPADGGSAPADAPSPAPSPAPGTSSGTAPAPSPAPRPPTSEPAPAVPTSPESSSRTPSTTSGSVAAAPEPTTGAASTPPADAAPTRSATPLLPE